MDTVYSETGMRRPRKKNSDPPYVGSGPQCKSGRVRHVMVSGTNTIRSANVGVSMGALDGEEGGEHESRFEYERS